MLLPKTMAGTKKHCEKMSAEYLLADRFEMTKNDEGANSSYWMFAVTRAHYLPRSYDRTKNITHNSPMEKQVAERQHKTTYNVKDNKMFVL